MFINVFISNVWINVDHGSLPGAADHIMADMNMNPFEFGMLGSVVYGGLVVGGGVATGVYNNSSRAKKALIFTLLFNSVLIYIFTLFKSFYLAAFTRFWLGFFQVFSCIYMPVWADVYANEKQKSAWVTILLLASPVGVIAGYTLTSIMVSYATWHWSFYVQAVGIMISAIVYAFVPDRYMDIDQTTKQKKKFIHNVQ